MNLLNKVVSLILFLMLSINVFHLRIKLSDLKGAKLAVLPGDPERVKKIALLMENPLYLSSNREFTIWSAEVNGNIVCICSTGIGGPSISVVVEELSQLGIRYFLRVGTAGAIQDYINVGDLLVVEAAVRCDGASCHFAPIGYPAISDFYFTDALIKTSKRCGVDFHLGTVVSSDTFYPGQERTDTYSGRVINSLFGSMSEWNKIGVIGYEMESATLLTMCKTQGLHAGVILGVIVNRSREEIPNQLVMNKVENQVIMVAVESVRYLFCCNTGFIK